MLSDPDNNVERLMKEWDAMLKRRRDAVYQCYEVRNDLKGLKVPKEIVELAEQMAQDDKHGITSYVYILIAIIVMLLITCGVLGLWLYQALLLRGPA